MSEDLTTGIGRILTPDGSTAGTGFVVTDDGLIATCAHVVESAGAGPGDRVTVVFYAAGEKREARVEPDWWRAPDAEDVTILRLEGPLPEGAEPLLLGSSSGTSGHLFKTFGFPAVEGVEGMWGYGTVGDPTTEAGRPVLQLTGTTEVTPGFSGAPVFDNATRRVVGMVTAITVPDRLGRLGVTAFTTPADTLVAVNPALTLHLPAEVEAYLVAVRDYCANLPYLTLHGISPPRALGEVYVPLRARSQPRRAKKREAAKERVVSEAWRTIPVSIAEVMRSCKQPHVLILGEPGAGKSTLLRQLAEHTWDAPERIGLDEPCLPILIPLRRLAATEGSLEDRLNRALTSEMVLTQKLPDGFFTAWPTQTGARWLILLDALDEVSTDERLRLLQWLKGAFKNIGQHRVVIASRPSGYAPGEFGEELFSQYELLPFTPEQTIDFALKWFGDRADHFIEEFERVRAGDLRGTPLLLTIAAKVYLENGALPERRSTLYGHFVDVWLDEAEQRGLKAELGERVCKVAKFALARLALAMSEGPGEFSTATLNREAADYLREALNLSIDEAEADGAKFVRVMARRSGVFTRRGDVYDFVHPTFREYLMALALAHEARDNEERVWITVGLFWQDAGWREVIQFLIGILSDERIVTAQLLDWIASHGEEGILFVAGCLVDGANAPYALQERVLGRLLNIARDNGATLWIRYQAIEALQGLDRHDDLLALACDNSVDPSVSSAAVMKLGLPGYIECLGALVHEPCVDMDVRGAAVLAVAQGAEGGEVDPVLSDMVREVDLPSSVRCAAIEGLALRRRLDALITLAHDPGIDAFLRRVVATSVGEMGQADIQADTLLAIATVSDVDAWTRIASARDLIQLGLIEQARQAYLTLARDVKIPLGMRREAVAALGDLSGTDQTAVACVRALARDSELEEAVREAAVRAMGALGYFREYRDLYLVLVRDSRSSLRIHRRAARHLKSRGFNRSAVETLAALARDARWLTSERTYAVAELGRWGSALAIEALRSLAYEETLDEAVRRRAVFELQKMHMV